MSFFFAGRVLGRFEALRTLLFKNSLNRTMGFTALLYPTMASPAIMASGSVLYGIGIVATGTLLQREFTDEKRATMGSINSLGGSLLFGVVSFSLGLGADFLSPRGSLLVTEALLILPLLAFWRLFRQEGSRKARGILPS